MAQSDSAGKVSMLVAVPSPPVITSPAIGKLNEIQTTDFHRTCFWVISHGYMLIELKIKLTCWAIVSLAGEDLGEVEERKYHGGTREKNHLQETSLSSGINTEQ